MQNNAQAREGFLRSPLRMVFVLGSLIFISEAVVMLILSGLPPLKIAVEAMVDAALLMVFVSPVLYFLLFRPLLRLLKEEETIKLRLKIANEEWDRTFNAISDPIFIQDKDNNIIRANKVFLQLMNMTESDVVGKLCYEVVHKLHHSWPSCPFERTKADLQPHTEEVDDPNVGVPLLITTSPIIDSQGQLVGAVHISKDISERKKIETELREAAQIKSYFTSMVSHELRTPLAAIKEGLDIVLDGTEGEISPQQRECLGISKNNVDRLTRLINDILDFQKLETGKMSFNFQEHDINAMVEEVNKMMVPLAQKKGLEFVVRLQDGMPKINCDKDRITQVLLNIVNNAIKFTREGCISIDTSSTDNQVKVTVKDTGLGIKKDDLGRLFKQFVQIKDSGVKSGGAGGGTGLGLAISKEIIERHGGKIWAESIWQEGTAFHFILPIAERRA